MRERRRAPYRRATFPGQLRHAPLDRLARHRHDHAFAAVVLAGHYTEAGDTGCHRVSAGHVVIHGPFEAHTDCVDRSGADVLILPVPEATLPAHGLVKDPDALARMAEHDLALAARALALQVVPCPELPSDWPDALAAALRADPDLNLGQWACAVGMHAGSLSRGFHAVFSITPREFRLIQRTHKAIQSIFQGAPSLSGVASDTGFADQAHMTRAIKRMTGCLPSELAACAAAAELGTSRGVCEASSCN